MVSMIRVRPPRTRLPVWRWLRRWRLRWDYRRAIREAAEYRRGEYTVPLPPDERNER